MDVLTRRAVSVQWVAVVLHSVRAVLVGSGVILACSSVGWLCDGAVLVGSTQLWCGVFLCLTAPLPSLGN